MIQYSEENLECRRYRERSNRIHMKKLKDIKSRNFSIEPSTTQFDLVNKRKNKFKENEVNRQNMMLYDRLTKISERIQNKNQIKGPKSLNVSMRKKEAERIIQGNFEFVKRLAGKESIFSFKKLRREIEIQEKYKNTISRHNLHERLQKITDSELKLPPINQEYAKGASTSRILKISKESKNEIFSDQEKTPKINESSPSQTQIKKIQTIQIKTQPHPTTTKPGSPPVSTPLKPNSTQNPSKTQRNPRKLLQPP